MMDGGGMGHMHHGGGMGGGMMFGGSPERMGRMIDHMLDGLNASDAQRSQIKQIAAGRRRRSEGAGETGRALRQRGDAGVHGADGRRRRGRAGARADARSSTTRRAGE